MYEVSREPEIRREVSQLHRCEESGRDAVGTSKMWVAVPQKQDTVSSRKASILCESVSSQPFSVCGGVSSGGSVL